MSFQGTWKNINTGDLIRLLELPKGDVYLLEYDYDGQTFQTEEEVSIYISNPIRAHIPDSIRFGRSEIHVESEKRIIINNEIYELQ
ncbi:MAG: hypothetical protein K9H64_10210 [Bacteroidales bacterium]|nr:hypothetical protein [Bacteroidales bacterium]MCF8456241.1 hypothetical protein [Bacteroidales bacterium]